MYRSHRVAAIIPARDEEASIKAVITELQGLAGSEGERLIDQIVVCDNGSTDNTAQLAIGTGASLVHQGQAGYGIACLTALDFLKSLPRVTRPDIILFVDGDKAFDVRQGLALVSAIGNGADLAIGSRTLGHCEQGALTLPQRFGNRLACFLIRCFWNKKVTDLGPFRAISSRALNHLAMADQAFGWTIEMQIKAIQCGMSIVERPVDTYCRLGRSKISGTVRGVIGAGWGIISTIVMLRWRQRQTRKYFSLDSAYAKSH